MLNLEAESSFIGCLLKEGDLIKETVITSDKLHDPFNKNVFNIITELDNQNETIDVVSVVVASKGKIDKKRLAEIVNGIATTENFKFLESKIIESWQLREVNKIKSKEITSISDIAELKDALSNISVNVEKEYNHSEAMVELYQTIENQKEGMSGYKTGFKDMDRILDGFQEGDLIISAARPSLGKTAKMLAHAKAHCDNGGVTVIFSLEMGADQLNRRLLSNIGRINGHKMRNPKQYFASEDWGKFTNALAISERYKLYIYDKSGQTVNEIRSKVAELRKKYPNEEILVMIDYLQLIRSDKNYESKNIEVGEITRTLKEIARENKVPVYLLSQLSRGVTQRQDKRPMMSDLRDSGSIEQDADVIELLHRDDYYDDENTDNIMEVIIAKQRNGSVGTVELVYIKEHNLFLDLERTYQ